jgi:hypothetical protein
MEKNDSRLAKSEALNCGSRNSFRSSSGEASFPCRRTKANPTARPSATVSPETALRPTIATCFSPYTKASTAISESVALTRSRRPASGSRYSGRSRGPSTSSIATAGSPIRKTDPHQKSSSRAPPASGPMAPPSEKLITQNPIALVRSAGSLNITVISESVDGASVPPAMPSSARAAISIGALVDRAASTDAAPKPAAPSIRSRRRPIRSPSVPIVISDAATKNP